MISQILEPFVLPTQYFHCKRVILQPEYNCGSPTCHQLGWRKSLAYTRHPTLSVPQLIKLPDFSKNEQEDFSIRMCIYCHMKKWTINPDDTNALPPMAVTCIGDNGTLSSVTEASIICPTTKVKSTSKTAFAAQTMHQA